MQRSLPGAIAVACLLPTLMLAGCTTPEQRHKVLTFFFTGVPDPLVAPEGVDASKMSPEELHQAILKARARANFKPPGTYAHAPAVSNQCEFCHQMGSDKGGVGARKIGPEMVAPVEKLCIGCHDDKGRDYAESLGMVSHKPVGDGMCVLCHEPHHAKQRYMLRGESRQKLCLICHTGKHAPIPPPGPHAWIFGLKIECTECHNPHFGKTSRMFRSQFDERQRYQTDAASEGAKP